MSGLTPNDSGAGHLIAELSTARDQFLSGGGADALAALVRAVNGAKDYVLEKSLEQLGDLEGADVELAHLVTEINEKVISKIEEEPKKIEAQKPKKASKMLYDDEHDPYNFYYDEQDPHNIDNVGASKLLNELYSFLRSDGDTFSTGRGRLVSKKRDFSAQDAQELEDCMNRIDGFLNNNPNKYIKLKTLRNTTREVLKAWRLQQVDLPTVGQSTDTMQRGSKSVKFTPKAAEYQETKNWMQEGGKWTKKAAVKETHKTLLTEPVKKYKGPGRKLKD